MLSRNESWRLSQGVILLTVDGGERRERICPFGIPITNMSEDHVQEILDGNSKEYGEIPEASEEKAALKPFLNPTLGYPRTYFVHSPIMNGKSS